MFQYSGFIFAQTLGKASTVGLRVSIEEHTTFKADLSGLPYMYMYVSNIGQDTAADSERWFATRLSSVQQHDAKPQSEMRKLS